MSTQEFIRIAQLKDIKIVHIANSAASCTFSDAFPSEVVGILHRDLIMVQGLAGPAPQGI